ncbi:MAG: hypothetical protein IKY23_01355 [Lachnospiraceae bacterium]|nr:hypothetical protein [Lachnospiraceae bacterium]
MNDFDKKIYQMAEKEQMMIPEKVSIKIDAVLRDMPVQKRKGIMNLKRAVLLAAVLSLLCSVTAAASVGFVKQRMEALNREKLEEFFVQIYTSKAPADNYNRSLTEEERLRKEELLSLYSEKGRFPKGELLLLEKAEDYRGKKVAYLPDTGTFFFPKEEMNDEELLQYIDFLVKRDYSLQKMNEMIAEGEADIPEEVSEKEVSDVRVEGVLNTEAIWDPGQELVIPYKGEVSVTTVAAGKDRIYLGGISTVHQMAVGGSESKVFFDDFEEETQVSFIYEDSKGNVYVAGAELDIEAKAQEETPYSLPPRQMVLWKLNKDGKLLSKFKLSVHGNEKGGYVNELVVDEVGNIYIIGLETNKLHVLNAGGELLTEIDSGEFRINSAGGMGVGKDGKVYVTVYQMVDAGRRLGIASVDLENGCLLDIYEGIVPDGTIMLDVIARGADTDFVFWGYDGIFTYNLGNEEAVHVMPAYEMPCVFESAPVCGLFDGRILIASCDEYREAGYGNGWIRHLRVPEETCFYYLSAPYRAKD